MTTPSGVPDSKFYGLSIALCTFERTQLVAYPIARKGKAIAIVILKQPLRTSLTSSVTRESTAYAADTEKLQLCQRDLPTIFST